MRRCGALPVTGARPVAGFGAGDLEVVFIGNGKMRADLRGFEIKFAVAMPVFRDLILVVNAGAFNCAIFLCIFRSGAAGAVAFPEFLLVPHQPPDHHAEMLSRQDLLSSYSPVQVLLPISAYPLQQFFLQT